MDSEVLTYMMLNAMPVLAVSAIGITVAVIHLQRWPKPARLVIGGCAILFTVAIVFPFIDRILIDVLSDFSRRSPFSIIILLDLIQVLLNAAAVALLLMAVFVGRDTELPIIEIEVPEAALTFTHEQIEIGRPLVEIQTLLQEQGVNRETFVAIQSRLKQEKVATLRAAGRKNMEFGALWCAGGLGATILALASDPRIGPKYVLTCFAVVYGSIHFVSGVKQLFDAKSKTADDLGS